MSKIMKTVIINKLYWCLGYQVYNNVVNFRYNVYYDDKSGYQNKNDLIYWVYNLHKNRYANKIEIDKFILTMKEYFDIEILPSNHDGFEQSIRFKNNKSILLKYKEIYIND